MKQFGVVFDDDDELLVVLVADCDFCMSFQAIYAKMGMQLVHVSAASETDAAKRARQELVRGKH